MSDLTISFEFFPPKSEAMEERLWDAMRKLEPLGPDFVSVTYGAGGSTRERTHRTVKRVLDETGMKPAAHLTCVAASRADVDDVLAEYWAAGVRHIVALRGDPPAGVGTKFEAHPDGYLNATDVTAAARRIGDFDVSVSFYPETHPESPNLQHDLDVLKAKIDAGATRAISQFFCDAEVYLRFRDAATKAGITIPLLPGIMAVGNVAGYTKMANSTGTSIPAWFAEAFDGLDATPEVRDMVAASVAADLCLNLQREGVDRFHFYTLNRAELTLATCRRLGPQNSPIRAEPSMTYFPDRAARLAKLEDIAKERILILDGAMGTMIQTYDLQEADYRGTRFVDHGHPLKGNNDLLVVTKPEVISEIHEKFMAAGVDMLSTNSFNATSISQADYALEPLVYELNLEAAKLARAACLKFETPNAPKVVVGTLGPTNKTLSLSPDVNDPSFRAASFDEMVVAYTEQANGLLDGGVDFLMVETIFDTLVAKAALYALDALMEERGDRVPIMISGTITDRSGRTLSGQTVEGFWNAVRHVNPWSIGLNCALGPKDMRPFLAELSRVASCKVSAYPNAGLPNAFGGYDETPEDMCHVMGPWANEGMVNILGGCCGTTPDHIKHIAHTASHGKPRVAPQIEVALRLSGLEPFTAAA